MCECIHWVKKTYWIDLPNLVASVCLDANATAFSRLFETEKYSRMLIEMCRFIKND